VVDGYDDDVLDERDIPAETVDPAALLLEPGKLAALGAGDGDTVALRLTTAGLVLERVVVITQYPAGERLAATLDADKPTYVDAAVWTACVPDPALFTEPLPPLSESIEDYGLARSGELLAPGGFDFRRWRFDLRCELLGERHGIAADDALVLTSLIDLYGTAQRSLEADDPGQSDAILSADNSLAARLADPLLAELLVAETVGDRGSAAALGLLAEVMESRAPRAAKVAWRWLLAVALERMGDIEAAESCFDCFNCLAARRLEA
jgi:hypothetical protein